MIKRIKKIIPAIAVTLLMSGFTGSYNPYAGGYYNCTWTAWQLAYDKLGITMPNFGNAGSWYSSAAAAGYYVDQYPSANSIAVWSGHVGYVDDYDPATNMMFVEQGGMRITSSGYWAGWMNVGVSLGGQGLIGFIHLDGVPGYEFSGNVYGNEYSYTDEYDADELYYQTDDADFPTLDQQEEASRIAATQREEASEKVKERPMINTFAISIDAATPSREIPDEKQSPKLQAEATPAPSGIPSEVTNKIAENESTSSSAETSNKMAAPLKLF